MALRDAVHTSHAARIVDRAVERVDARGLAMIGTFGTADALGGVDDRFEDGETREESQERADGADGVAPQTAVADSEESDEQKRDNGDEKRGREADPDIDMIESVATEMFGEKSEEVVEADIDRLENVGSDTSEEAIGVDESGQCAEANDDSHHKKGQHHIAKNGVRFAIVETVLVPTTGEMCAEILHKAQRAEDRAIDAAAEEGEQQQGDKHNDVGRKDGGGELSSGQPREIGVKKSRQVEEKENEAYKKEGSEKDA